jgi:hypothetical protein
VVSPGHYERLSREALQLLQLQPAQLLLDAQLRAHGLPGSASNKAGYTLVEYPTDAPRAVILRD